MALLSLVALGALAAGPPALAIAGKGGKFEFAIDAPWRLEPTPDRSGGLGYGAIPIQVSIHDAFFSALDEQISHPGGTPVDWHSTHHLGRFIQLIVTEVVTAPGQSPGTLSQEFGLLDLDVIERTTGVWQKGAPACWDEPRTTVCEVWRDPSCAAESAWIRGTSEWHAVLHYLPRGRLAPGATVRLQVTAKVSRSSTDLPATGEWLHEVSLYDMLNDAHLVEDASDPMSLVSEMEVYLGDEPLPRFGNDWLYGDLHYHSQGTDNEGESAYNYRGVLAAMGALGLDFAFATEHASNSLQYVDGDSTLFPPGADGPKCGLRDMSPHRFQENLIALHGDAGADRAAMALPGGRLPQGYLSHHVVPQVFLGGEVDVLPEMELADMILPTIEVDGIDAYLFGCELKFGDGLRMSLNNLCGGGVDLNGPLPGDTSGCSGRELIESIDSTTVTLLDVQGVNKRQYHARQHLIYLPGSQDDEQAFVASNTEEYGGGSRSLFRYRATTDPVVPEIESKDGWFFIAHPLDSNHRGTAGPDLVPYSDYQLRKLMRSPAFLGLQFWNEDGRVSSDAFEGPPPMSNRDGVLGTSAFPLIPDGVDDAAWKDGLLTITTNDSGEWNPVWTRSDEDRFEGKLYHGAYLWDRMLLWGLGLSVPFARGCEPRKVLMAGGSDAHGDFNYRRSGYFFGTDTINDTAIGKPRNLVRVGAPDGQPIGVYVPHSQAQVIAAIRAGNSCVTDGPALRIAMDVNANGNIDDHDVPMGGTYYFAGDDLPLLLEWKSTPEFGPLHEIHIYVGAGSSADCSGEDRNCAGQGVVYAPLDAGPRNSGDDQYPTPGPEADRPGLYFTDEALRIDRAKLGHDLGYAGTYSISLSRLRYRNRGGARADRLYVRAFADTYSERCTGGSPIDPRCRGRFAFTNPVWCLPDDLIQHPPMKFIRGDSNGDGVMDVSDAVKTLAYLFLGGAAPGCLRAADTDDNDQLEITDAVRTLTHLFQRPMAPPAPYPGCGTDDSLLRDQLSCLDGGACAEPGSAEPKPSIACLSDLTIPAISADALVPGHREGFKVPVHVTVRNAGSKPARVFKLKFSPGGHTALLGPLDGGASGTIVVQLPYPETYLGRVIHILADADSDGEVEEVDEDNNRSAEVTVDFPETCDPPDDEDPMAPRLCYDLPADLIATTLKLTSAITSGDRGNFQAEMQVHVENVGAGSARPFHVAIRAASAVADTPWTIDGLEAGETRTLSGTVSFPFTTPRGVKVALTAVVDSKGEVAESDEANNLSAPVVVVFP